MNPVRDHWPHHARQWARIGPPLRPDRDDVAITRGELAAWTASAGRAPRALILGVTPELAALPWPPGTALTGVDRALAMIDAVWPRDRVPPGARAVAGEWTALPLADRTVDLALGDGVLSNLAFPGGYAALAAELHRVLDRDGRVVVRVFAAPARPVALAEVAAALAAGAVASVHALKWQLAMAIQRADRNVAVAAILDAFDALVPDRDALAARTGWSRDAIDTVDAYRGSTLRYSFPTLDEVVAAVAAHLTCATVHAADRESRYPTVAFTPR